MLISQKHLPEFHATARQLVHIQSQMNPIHTLPSYALSQAAHMKLLWVVKGRNKLDIWREYDARN
jgi:hypothetical protein